MGFMRLFEVASMPILQVIIVSGLGAFMATNYLNLLSGDTRKSLNKIVFVTFTPSLMFASLVKTITFHDIVTWWFMPINIGLTFLFGGILGWIAVKVLKPKPHLEGLIIAMCSTANLGNLLLIIVPAICSEAGSPFGSHSICSSHGLSYSSFSMAVGGLYIWTYTYHLIKTSSSKYKAMKIAEGREDLKQPNKEFDANEKTNLLSGDEAQNQVVVALAADEDPEHQQIVYQGSSSKEENEKESFLIKLIEVLRSIVEELMAPPTLAAIAGFVFGTVPWLKNLLVGDDALLRVIYDSTKLLGDGTIPCITLILGGNLTQGDGTIPCITLILGGNLTQGLRKASLTPLTIIVIICVRYIILPVIGIGVVKTANNFGLLPSDPLFQFVLMLQFTLPPAMNIGTMTQLLEVGQEECSVLMMWTYLAATLALTAWSTVFMWILT